MRWSLVVAAMCVVAGCASPPKPKECEGEFKPVNPTSSKVSSLDRASSLALCHKGEVHEHQG